LDAAGGLLASWPGSQITGVRDPGNWMQLFDVSGEEKGIGLRLAAAAEA
jgi:hypothetical protein